MNLPIDKNTGPCSNPLSEVQLNHRNINTERVSCNDTINSRKQWWQRSIVRRSYSSIESEFENLVSSSPFLKQNHSIEEYTTKAIAIFHRSEIVTGELLGKGGFSQVTEIVAFDLISEISNQRTPEEQRLREYYAETVLHENGMCRYCIKHLQEKLTRKPSNFQLAASDLAIEAATLSSLNQHENIVSVRGLPINGLKAWKYGQHDGYFIVMDRLVTTLDKRIQEWSSGTLCRKATIQDKANSALQLASALQYLHSNRLLYRDLKPHNIGFTFDDKLQLFDFGLCRELPIVTASDDLYEMSGVGTRRYMAPEIIKDGRYNQKADVYGWSMVFWEMLTLTKPYSSYSTDDHTLHVCQNNERPSVQLHWPYWIHNILSHSWNDSIDLRFTIHEVVAYLQSALNDEINYRMNDLYASNHETSMSNVFSMPTSPTGVLDFPSNFGMKEERKTSIKSLETRVSLKSFNDSIRDNYDSVEFVPEMFHGGAISPPPAPKRPPTTFVKVPDTIVRTFGLSLSDDDNDNDDDDALRAKTVRPLVQKHCYINNC